MKSSIKTLLLTGALIATTATGALAETKQTREVTELVGYNETITIVVPHKDEYFASMDRNGDGVVTFREFANKAMLDNEYEIFLEIDTNRNKLIDLAEYRAYDSKTKGQPFSETVGDTRYSVDGSAKQQAALEQTGTTTRFVPKKTYNFRHDPNR